MERRQPKPEVKSIKKRSASVLNCKMALKKDGSVRKTILTPYLVSLRGPILLSAAHSTKIMRGGKLTKTKERTHLREQWVSTIVLKVALEIERL